MTIQAIALAGGIYLPLGAGAAEFLSSVLPPVELVSEDASFLAA